MSDCQNDFQLFSSDNACRYTRMHFHACRNTQIFEYTPHLNMNMNVNIAHMNTSIYSTIRHMFRTRYAGCMGMATRPFESLQVKRRPRVDGDSSWTSFPFLRGRHCTKEDFHT